MHAPLVGEGQVSRRLRFFLWLGLWDVLFEAGGVGVCQPTPFGRVVAKVLGLGPSRAAIRRDVEVRTVEDEEVTP